MRAPHIKQARGIELSSSRVEMAQMALDLLLQLPRPPRMAPVELLQADLATADLAGATHYFLCRYVGLIARGVVVWATAYAQPRGMA